MSDLIERLRSNGALAVCPFDKRSPDYYTTPNDKPCKFCGGLPEGPDKCTGADLRIMSEAADAIAAKDREIAETRQRTIEECAKVASSATYTAYMHWDPETPLRRNVEHRDAIATAIRSLGKEGSGEQDFAPKITLDELLSGLDRIIAKNQTAYKQAVSDFRAALRDAEEGGE